MHVGYHFRKRHRMPLLLGPPNLVAVSVIFWPGSLCFIGAELGSDVSLTRIPPGPLAGLGKGCGAVSVGSNEQWTDPVRGQRNLALSLCWKAAIAGPAASSVCVNSIGQSR